MSNRPETRSPVPELPKLPRRHNRIKRVIDRAVGHALCLFAGLGLLIGVGEGVALGTGMALVVLSLVLAASAFRVGPSSCAACGGALELSPVRHLRARVVFTTATCVDCGERYEYLRQPFADVE